jgi:hypothetical protein
VLEKQVKSFREFRGGNKRWMKILEPTVHVLYTLSLTVGNGIGLVRLQLASLGSISPDHHFSGFSAYIGSHRRYWSPLCGLFLPRFLLYFSCDGKVYYQTAKNFRANDDALIDLFDCIGGFLKRLRNHKTFSAGIAEIAIRIMSELLSVFALATQQMKMGGFSEFILRVIVVRSWLSA